MKTERTIRTLPPEVRVRHERLGRARYFLRHVLLRPIAKGEALDQRRIEALLDQHKAEHRNDIGMDFELPHVWLEARRYLIRARRATEESGTRTPELDLAQQAYDVITDAEKARTSELM
jgi:hypothetical protein